MGNTKMLKEVQKIARDLKSKNSKLKHTEAVKQAWKQVKAAK